MRPSDVEISAGRLKVRVCSYGARVARLVFPSKDGRPVDCVLGFPDSSSYLADQDPYFGCIVGRVANRISGGAFELNGERYILSRNEGRHTLHGGWKGWSRVQWTMTGSSQSSVTLLYNSPSGEEGFPGDVYARVTYRVTAENELSLDIAAECEEPTPINITNHSYFNLNGEGDIRAHMLESSAFAYLPVDDSLIPTGEVRAVADSPFDFHTPRALGMGIERIGAQSGFDHCLVYEGTGMKKMCTLSSDESGITLEIHSTQPGLQLYTGNYLSGECSGHSGRIDQYGGVALEPQGYPNAVNCRRFPSVICHPNRPYRQKILYRFGHRGSTP